MKTIEPWPSMPPELAERRRQGEAALGVEATVRVGLPEVLEVPSGKARAVSCAAILASDDARSSGRSRGRGIGP